MTEISARPVFLYDGDCAFCSSCARFIMRRIRSRATVLPWQTVDIEPLGLTVQQCDEAVQWIDESGRIFSGPQAVAQLLIDAKSVWRPLGWLLRIPPSSWLAEPAYRLVARNRHRMPGGTPTCSLPQAKRGRPAS
ncbi:MAG: thiol-disulfide oxidoreductase DCC family protein [Terriglobales bacterium]